MRTGRGRVWLLLAFALEGCSGEVPVGGSGGSIQGAEAVQLIEGGPADTMTMDPALIDRPLDGTEWVLESVYDQDVPPGSLATMTFDRELERVSGHTGCNPFTGSYDLIGTRLVLSGFGLTRLACPSGFDQVEVDVLEAFRTTGSFRISADVLELMSEMGAVARYRARAVR